MDNVKIMLMKMENENRIMCMVPMEKEHAGADEPGPTTTMMPVIMKMITNGTQ